MKYENTTYEQPPARKRSYQDGCSVAQALDLIGERWALLVLRELQFGPRRFSDLRGDLPAITASVLTQRLAELEQTGLVQRVPLPRPARGQAYDATDWGRGFAEVLRVMGQWTARSPHMRHDWPLSEAGAMLSLNSMFAPGRAGDTRLVLVFDLPDRPFTARIENAGLTVTAGADPAPDATLSGNQNAVLSILYSPRPLSDALATGDLRVAGDSAAVTRFAALFDAPVPAPLPGAG